MYCSHLWNRPAEYQLAALDSVERRAKRFIDDETLVSKLHTLAHQRNIVCLLVFYRLYFGECAHELHDLIPPSPFHYPSTRLMQDTIHNWLTHRLIVLHIYCAHSQGVEFFAGVGVAYHI